MTDSLMIADGTSHSSTDSGFPKYDETDPEGSRFRIEIALKKHKERPHLSLKPEPVDPGARANQAARDDYRVKLAAYERQEEVAYSLVMESTYSSPSAYEVAILYHKEQEAADPPKRHSGKELLDRLEDRFRGEKVTLLEDSLRKYNNWRIMPEKENLMVAVDRLKSLIQRLTGLGHVVTEASKVERLKDGLNCDRYHHLVVIMSVLPAAETTFDTYVTMIKNYDKSSRTKISDDREESSNVSSFGEAHMLTGKQKRFLRSGGGKQVPGSQTFTGCFQCGSVDHAKKDCPELDENYSHSKSKNDRHSRQKESEDNDDLELEVKRLKRKLAAISDKLEEASARKTGKGEKFSRNPQDYVIEGRGRKKSAAEIEDSDEENWKR